VTTTTPDSRRSYVRGEGARVRRFGERYIVQTKGRWAGNKLIHQPWQHQFLDELFLRYDNGERVYREALLGIARKNGKSTTGSEVALYGLMGTPEHSPEVYAAAAAKDQARVVFGQSTDFVEASPLLRQWLKPQRSVIYCKANRGIFRVLASDAPLQYGLNPNMVVIDELWAHANPELYYALTTGQLARLDPLVVSATTAGFDRDTICHELYERGVGLRDEGGIAAMRKARFLFWWYEVDAQADYRDESVWKQANPSDWITLDVLRHEHERLPESVFRRLHLNQWTETDEAWVKTWEWDACRGRPLFDTSQPSYMAVDVGIRRDSAAIIWGQWHGEQLHVGHHILIPHDEGPGFGVADIRGEVARRASVQAQLRECDFDPWQFLESAEILAERGFPMVEFPQNAARMAPASETLYELITERRIVHDGNAELKRQILSAVAAPTDRGGWRISKRRSQERIDAAVALAMMADRAVTLRHAVPKRATVHF
jgi:phage terminase large subunit-like protein